MVKRTAGELKAYGAPGYFGCAAIRIRGKEETEVAGFWIGVPIFPLGGGAEYTYEDSPLEEVYCALEREMTVKNSEGGTYVIHKDKSIPFRPFKGRYLKNESNFPARMLVAISYPEA